MSKYAVYQRASGRILYTGRTNAEFWSIVPSPDDQSITAIADDVSEAMHYVMNGEIALRPASTITIDKTEIAADGVDAATLTGIPEPSDLVVNGQTVTVADGTPVLTARHRRRLRGVLQAVAVSPLDGDDHGDSAGGGLSMDFLLTKDLTSLKAEACAAIGASAEHMRGLFINLRRRPVDGLSGEAS